MLNRNTYINILEAKQFDIEQEVYIHHHITEDVVKCRVKDTKIDKILLTFDQDSDYFGQPEFWFKKIHVIGKV